MSYIDPIGLAKCTYSIKTGVLSCQSNDGNRQFVSGQGSFSPIPTGSYKITPAADWPKGFFSLSRGAFMNQLYRINKRVGGPVRGGFMLHPGHNSEGCITVNSSNDNDMKNYQNVQDLISSELGDSTLEVFGD